MEVNPILKRLLELGVSKWSIKNYTGTPWNNVHAWSNGWWKPGNKYASKLEAMLHEVETTQVKKFKPREEQVQVRA